MLKEIKSGLIFGITVGISILIIGASYAAWNTITSATTNGNLTSSMYNQIVDRLNSIDEQQLSTAWVNFDGSSSQCNLGAGNDCLINGSYNISKVTRLGSGYYEIFFETSMDNTGYSVSGIGNKGGTIDYHRGFSVTYDDGAPTTSSFKIHHEYGTNLGGIDTNFGSIQIFGGKTY